MKSIIENLPDWGLSEVIIKKGKDKVSVKLQVFVDERDVQAAVYPKGNLSIFNFILNYNLHKEGVKHFEAKIVGGNLEIESDVKILELK